MDGHPHVPQLWKGKEARAALGLQVGHGQSTEVNR